MSDEYFKRSAKKHKKERSLHFSAFFAQKCHVTEEGGGKSATNYCCWHSFNAYMATEKKSHGEFINNNPLI